MGAQSWGMACYKEIPLKTIRKQKRPQYSFFRYGLDLIRDLITRPPVLQKIKKIISLGLL